MEDVYDSALPSHKAPPGGRLSDGMLADLDRAGVIILTDFCSRERCDALKARALELVDAFDPATVRSVFSTTTQTQLDDDYFVDSGDKIRFFLEDDAFDAAGKLRQAKSDSLNKIGHAMHDLDPVFDDFSRGPELAEIGRRLGYDEPGIIQSMYIFKPPRIGGEVVCHQDSTYIYTEPESCYGFWFAIEDATLENGCMQFIPGAHKGPLKARNYRQPGGGLVTETLDESGWPEERRLAMGVTPGLVRLSGPNRSDRSRHAYTLHVIDQAAHYPDVNWLQRGDDLPLRGFDERVF